MIPYINKIDEFDITEYQLDEDLEIEKAVEFDEIYDMQVSNAEISFDDNEIFQQEFTKDNLEDYIYEIEVIKDGVTRFIGVVDIESIEPDEDTGDYNLTLVNWYKYFYDEILSKTIWDKRPFSNLKELLSRMFLYRDNITNFSAAKKDDYFYVVDNSDTIGWKWQPSSNYWAFYIPSTHINSPGVGDVWYLSEVQIDVTEFTEFRFKAYSNGVNTRKLRITYGDGTGYDDLQFTERPVIAEYNINTLTPQEFIIYPLQEGYTKLSFYTWAEDAGGINYVEFTDFLKSEDFIAGINIAVTADQALRQKDIFDIANIVDFAHLLKECQKYFNALIYVDEDRILNFRHRTKLLNETAFNVDDNLIDDKEILVKKYTKKSFDGIIFNSGYSIIRHNGERDSGVHIDAWGACWYDKIKDARGSYLKRLICQTEDELTEATQYRELVDLRQELGGSGGSLEKQLEFRFFANRLDASAIQDYEDVLLPFEQVKCTVDIEDSKPKLFQEAIYGGHSYIIWRINENVDTEIAEIEIRRMLKDVDFDSPVNLQITNITDQSFTVSWDAVDGADGYFLELSTDENFSQSLLLKYDGDSGSGGGDTLIVDDAGFPTTLLIDTSIDVLGLTPYTTYYARVKAYVNPDATGESTESLVQALPASNIDADSFTANWEALDGADFYFIDVSTNSNFVTFLSGFENLVVGNITTYNVMGLDAGTTYYYRVRSNKGNSNSNVVIVTTIEILDGGDASTIF